MILSFHKHQQLDGSSAPALGMCLGCYSTWSINFFCLFSDQNRVQKFLFLKTIEKNTLFFFQLRDFNKIEPALVKDGKISVTVFFLSQLLCQASS